MKGDLTYRQENFAVEYVKTGSPNEAYKFAYSTSNMLKTTINRKAQEVLDVPKVVARIRHLKGIARGVATKKFKIDSEDILRHLDILRNSNIKDYVELVENKIKIGFDDVEMEDIYVSSTELRWKPFKKLTEEQLMCIDTIKETKFGIEIKLHGTDWSIDKISRHIGLYEKDNKQKVAPIEYKNVSKQFPKE